MSTVVVNRNLRSFSEALRVTPAALHDCTVVVDSVYREQEKRNFATEGSSGGKNWKPLSPEYKKAKDRLLANATGVIKGIAKARGAKLTGFALRAALGSDNKILQRTGDMKRAFSTQAASIPDAGGSGVGASHVAEGFILPTGARVQIGAQGPGYFARPDSEQRDPQVRNAERDNELRQGVRRALIPHTMATLRTMIRRGAPRAGGSSA